MKTSPSDILGMMNRSVPFLILFFIMQLAYAQEEIGLPNIALPPTPEAAAFNQYIDQPVSPYTGIPDISIPIYTVQSRELSLPISLSYHASGQKVEALPTWVGMGWSLNAGGIISRSVVGLPDDLAVGINNARTPLDGGARFPDGGEVYGAGYLYHADSTDLIVSRYEAGETQVLPTNSWWHTASTYRELVVNNSFDIEPDLFSFNFAGYSGKFVFDSDTSIQIIPKQPLKIKPYYDTLLIDSVYYCFGRSDTFKVFKPDYIRNLKITAFDVTVPDGTIYKFEAIEQREINPGHSTTYSSRFEDRFKFQPAKPYVQGGGRRCELNNKGCPGSKYNLKYNASWKLTKIVSANHTDEITLSYVDEKLLELSNISEANYIGNMTFPPEGSAVRTGKTLTIDSLKRLSAISWDGGKIYFDTALDTRADVMPSLVGSWYSGECSANETSTVKALEQIRIVDGSPKTFKLQQSYLTSPGIDNHPTEEKPHFRRLKLDKVWEETTNSILPAHVFNYNNTSLPDRMSHEQDFWGYYNGNGEDTDGAPDLRPTLYCYLDDPILDITDLTGSPQTNSDYHKLSQFSVFPRTGLTNDFNSANGADRQSNLTYMKAGVLEKWTLPTGGSVSYEYEMHDFRLLDHEDVSGSLNIKGGGLRIAKTILDDGIAGTPSITKEYQYQVFDEATGEALVDSAGDTISSGKIFSVPQFARLYPRMYPDRVFVYDQLRYKIQTTPMNGIETSRGSNVTYGSVAEVIPNNGKTIRYYSQPADFGTEKKQELVEGTLTTTYENSVNYHFFGDTTVVHLSGEDIPVELNPDFYPFPPNPNYDFMRGDLLKKIVFNEAGQKLETLEHNYTLLDVNGNLGFDRINSFTVKDDLAASWLRYGPYYYISAWKVLKQKIETTYDPADTTKQLSIVTNYGYENDNHLQQTSSEYVNSEGQLVRKEIRYPEEAKDRSVELNHVNALGLMWDSTDPDYRHMVGVPVEVLKYEDSVLVSKVANRYTIKSTEPSRKDMVLVDRNLNFPTGGFDAVPISASEEYAETNYEYDDFGNVKEYWTNDGMHTVLIWGYDHRYPVAKVENVTFNQLNGLYTAPGSGALNPSARGAILAAHPDAIVTLYEYLPDVGVSKVIDTNGFETTYTYDEFGRLEKVVDFEGNVLSQNEYNIGK